MRGRCSGTGAARAARLMWVAGDVKLPDTWRDTLIDSRAACDSISVISSSSHRASVTYGPAPTRATAPAAPSCVSIVFNEPAGRGTWPHWLKWKIWGEGTPFSAWTPKFRRGPPAMRAGQAHPLCWCDCDWIFDAIFALLFLNLYMFYWGSDK